MSELRLENYIVIPRQIGSDWRNGKITIAERNLLIWLRCEGNPYGIVRVDMESFAREAFNKPVTKAHINKLLLELKRKRYIYYLERKGHRGSFEVHLGDWIRPDKSIKTLDKHFEKKSDRSDEQAQSSALNEVTTELEPVTQKLSSVKSVEMHGYNLKSDTSALRASDTDIDKDNYNDELHTPKKDEEDILVTDYEVNSDVSDKLKRIAESVGEESMGFVIGMYKRHGEVALQVMEFVAIDLIDRPNIHDKRKYFNAEVRRRLE